MYIFKNTYHRLKVVLQIRISTVCNAEVGGNHNLTRFFLKKKCMRIALLLLLPKRKAFFGLEIKVRPQIGSSSSVSIISTWFMNWRELLENYSSVIFVTENLTKRKSALIAIIVIATLVMSVTMLVSSNQEDNTIKICNSHHVHFKNLLGT